MFWEKKTANPECDKYAAECHRRQHCGKILLSTTVTFAQHQNSVKQFFVDVVALPSRRGRIVVSS